LPAWAGPPKMADLAGFGAIANADIGGEMGIVRVITD
jgi:hypothetical protein